MIKITSNWNKPYRKKNKNNMILKADLKLDEIVPKHNVRNETPLHMVYLIDCSGSMASLISGNEYNNTINILNPYSNNHNGSAYSKNNGNVFFNNNSVSKLKKVKDATISSINLLSENDLFTVICFSNDASYVVKDLQGTPENKIKAINSINLIQASGGTAIHKGLTFAIDSLFQAESDHYKRRINLLTDGQATDNVPYDVFYNIARDMVSGNSPITISTFGVGEHFNEDFLLNLSVAGSGSFYYLDKDCSFSEIFVRELNETKSDYAYNLKMYFSGLEMENVELLNDFSLSNDGKSYILPNLISGREVSFALKGNAIGKQSSITINVSCNYQGNVVIFSETLRVDISSEDYINKEVEDFAIQLEIAKAQKEASKLIREGKRDFAMQELNRAKIMGSCMHDNQKIDLYNKELDNTLGELSRGELNLASKSSLNSSYMTSYSRN